MNAWHSGDKPPAKSGYESERLSNRIERRKARQAVRAGTDAPAKYRSGKHWND